MHLGAKLGGSRLSFVFSDLSPIMVVCVTEASRAEAVDDASPFIPRGQAYRLVWQLPVTMPRGWRLSEPRVGAGWSRRQACVSSGGLTCLVPKHDKRRVRGRVPRMINKSLELAQRSCICL